MIDYPSSVESSYGSLEGLPEDIVKYCEKVHDSLTVDQLRRLADYFNNKANKFKDKLESSVTIEEFEKAKKSDMDDDNEIGKEKVY